MAAPRPHAREVDSHTASPSLLRTYSALSLSTVLAAATFLVAKLTMGEGRLEPLELAWLRFTLSAAVYLVLLRALRLPLLPPAGTRWKFFILGIIALPINQGLFLAGLALSTPSHGAILYALTPAFVLLGGRLWLGDSITPRKAFGTALAFAGALLVLLEGDAEWSSGPLIGDLLIVGAVVAWAAYTVMALPYTREHGALPTAAWSMTMGTWICLPFGPWLVRPLDQWSTLGVESWLGLVYLAVATSVVAYYLYTYALRRLEAGQVAIFTNIQPVLTALMAWMLMDEQLGGRDILGGALVILGVSAVQSRARRKTEPAEAPLA